MSGMDFGGGGNFCVVLGNRMSLLFMDDEDEDTVVSLLDELIVREGEVIIVGDDIPRVAEFVKLIDFLTVNISTNLSIPRYEENENELGFV